MPRDPAAGRSLWIWEACRGLAVLAGHCSSSGIEAHVTTQFFIVAGDLSLSRLSHSDLSVWGIFSWRKLCNSTPLDILFEDPLFGKKFSSGEHHGSTVLFFRNGRVAAVMSPVAGGHEVQHVATFP
jgi:hypothetical protein